MLGAHITQALKVYTLDREHRELSQTNAMLQFHLSQASLRVSSNAQHVGLGFIDILLLNLITKMPRLRFVTKSSD